MHSPVESAFRLIARDEPGPWWLPPLRAASGLASAAYSLGASFNNLRYDLGWSRVRRLPAPVIGVGNLSVGGSGKTPLVIAIVKALGEMGLDCAVISRGYGRSGGEPVAWVFREGKLLADAAQAGDEPVMLAKALKVPVAVGADRYEVGKEVLKKCGIRVLVCDDLFQHRRLYRDLNILALDAARPFGNGRILPRGVLREPASGVRRADAVVLTRAEDAGAAADARALLFNMWGRGPVLETGHVLSGLSGPQGEFISPYDCRGRKVLAFCGLARPDTFRDGLKSLGLEVLDIAEFGDHHFFSAADLAGLSEKAGELGADALVTSQKDRVRIIEPPSGLPLLTTRLELRFKDGIAGLKNLLAQSMATWPERFEY